MSVEEKSETLDELMQEIESMPEIERSRLKKAIVEKLLEEEEKKVRAQGHTGVGVKHLAIMNLLKLDEKGGKRWGKV